MIKSGHPTALVSALQNFTSSSLTASWTSRGAVDAVYFSGAVPSPQFLDLSPSPTTHSLCANPLIVRIQPLARLL
ncbi:hypothetical protein B0H14DRAFT_3483510 [Mycena olivaceomarginata]|nr:hypothetical protein B0H14DRAFT_3483510 [Mycena olivaceomarginata]